MEVTAGAGRPSTASRLCVNCQKLPLHCLLFQPHDGRYLLGGTYDHAWHVNNSLISSHGTLSEVMERAKSCPLCRMLVTIIKKQVARELFAQLGNDSAYICKISFTGWVLAKPSVLEPPYKRALYRMRLCCFREPPDGSSSHPVDLSGIVQGALRKVPAVVDYLHDPTATPSPEVLKPSGRNFSPVCDVKLFARWLAQCERTHGCHTHKSRSPITETLRLIDVRDMCLKEFTGPDARDVRYLILSYTWNMDLSQCFLTKERLQGLKASVSLQSIELPRTISDAIHLAQALGEQYIWIDSLCIIQDDPEDQARQIPMMRRIYSNALLTLCACAGDNADSGLCGLKSGDRHFEPDTVILDDMALLSCCSPVSHEVLSWESDSRWNKTRWNTRGWTMQERLSSIRCLLFTKDQVYWECRNASWCEETQLETSNGFRFVHGLTDRFFLQTDWWKGAAPTHVQSAAIYQYEHFVSEYTQRQLSFDHDAMNAFLGVFEFFESEASISILCGLQVPDFEAALCWFTTDLVKPREAGSFPSWSWVAWRNAAEFSVLQKGSSFVYAYKFRVSGASFDLVPVGSSQVVHRSLYTGFPTALQRRRSAAATEISSITLKIVKEDFHIVFWTSAATFQLGGIRSVDGLHYTEIYPQTAIVKDSDKCIHYKKSVYKSHKLPDDAVGFCYGAVGKEVLSGTGAQHLRFVLISRCSQQRHPYSRLQNPLLVMLVCFDETEICRRICMAVIEQDEWLKSEPEERLVILG